MADVEANVQDEFFDSLLGDFLDESDQLLVQLNANLLDLDEWAGTLEEGEAARCDDDLMNEMFRAAHSIKGLSGMLGLDQINNMTHKIENIFDAARKDQLTLNCDTVELVFQSVDRLGALIEALKDPDADEVDCEGIFADIQKLLQEAGVEKTQATQADAERALALALEEAASSPPELSESPPSPEPSVPAAATVDYMQGVVDEQSVPAKYLSIFIDETDLSLDSLTDELLALEADGGGAADDGLLVVSHRIKGSAASVGLNRPAKLAHYMEDILQELRENNAPLTAELTDVMLKCTDALRTYVEGLKVNNPQSSQFGALIGELVEAQGRARQSNSVAAEPEATSASPQADQPAIPIDETISSVDRTDEGLADELLRQIAASAPQGIAAFTGVVYFDPELDLVGLKARLAFEKLSALGKVFYCDPPLEELDDLEQLKGLTFALSSEQSSERICSHLRFAGVQRLQLDPLPEELLQSAREETKQPQSTPAAVSQPPPKVSPAAAKKPAPAAAEAQSKSRAAEPSGKPAETLRVDIDRLDELMNLAGQLVINKARFSQIGEKMRPLIANKQTAHLLANAISSLEKMANDDGQNQRSPEANMEIIRSHARRILADLENVNRDVRRFVDARGSVSELYEAIHQLDRVTDGIQKSVMDTRMVPVGPLFTRFKRVIRDITRNSGKEMRLVIRGEKTELDKRMIDELGDPLIHMVRNSADHGIESPEERERAGKPRQGTVTLDAFHRGNSIVIQVSDDGKGLDLDKIREKALERGIVSKADLDQMTPDQMYQLIWEPGFSTAEKVTEISGRGMGMDIVRSKIEAINGTVELDSTPGKGSVFSIKLPLTLAILPSLMAEIDGDVIAIPVESVVEIVSVGSDATSTVHGQRTATVRGRVVSVVQLRDLFVWNSPARDCDRSSEGDDTTLVIIGSDGEELGLVVDRLLGEEDIVIKSMAENYRNVRGVAGASILGDGRVSLILDIATLIEMSAKLDTSAVTV